MRNSILYEYDAIRLGQKKEFSKTFFSGADVVNERIALDVFRYAIEYYLCWTPEDTARFLNMKIIEDMKLKPLHAYIRFPAELDKNEDLFYIAHLMYPNRIKYRTKDLVINAYKQILRGKKSKFMKNYMSGTKGYINACICFQYMMEQFLQFSTIKEAYEYFASPKGAKTLKEYRLVSVCNDMFENPLEYFHTALPESQKDEFWYKYHVFNKHNNSQIRQMKKDKSFII